MCTRKITTRLKRDWERFDEATEAGFIQSCVGFVFETRHCRRCHGSLAHPRDLARYGFLSCDAR